ncbi:MAG: CapA family protein, partial [Oscillospiraceae bacterium]|nr:CapA family protein [Oscillospiraceae bacterium]
DMLRDARSSSGMPDYTALFSSVITELSKADLTIGNLEGIFTGSGEGCYPDAFAEALAASGFDILQTANSYSVFQGLSGLVRTKDILEEQNILPVGTFRSAKERKEEQVLIREIDGIRFAFIAFTKGFNGMGLPADSDYCVNLLYEDYATDYEDIDKDGILSVVEAAVELEPDFIIASLHWGSENISGISSSQKQITDILLHAGVDVILGSHSHRLEQVERRVIQEENRPDRECIIAYGLGDFCTTTPGKSNTSVILNLEFTKDHDTGEHSISSVSYVPVSTVDNEDKYPNHYAVVATEDAIRLFENNYYLCVGEKAYEAMIDDLVGLDETIFPPPETEAPED